MTIPNHQYISNNDYGAQASAPQWSEINDNQSQWTTTNTAYPVESSPYTNQQNDRPTNMLIQVPSSNVLVDESHLKYQSASAQNDDYYHPPHQQPLVVTTDAIPTGPRTFRGKVVKPKNAHLSDEVLAFKETRKGNTVASTWIGGVVGLFVLGPVMGPAGAAAGAGIAYGISKSVGKAHERKLIARDQRQAALHQQALVVRHDQEPNTTNLPELT